MDLTWTDNSAGENGYLVERSTDGGTTWTQIASIGADSNSYADTSVTTGNTYKYRVKAYNDAGNSGLSNVATVLTP